MTSQILLSVYQGVNIFINIISVLIFAYCILSWITMPTNGLYRFIAQLVEPILTPFRPIGRWLINKGFRIDFTPWIAMFALRLLQNLLFRLFRLLIYGF